MIYTEDSVAADGRECCRVMVDGVSVAEFFCGDRIERRASARFYLDCIAEVHQQFGESWGEPKKVLHG